MLATSIAKMKFNMAADHSGIVAKILEDSEVIGSKLVAEFANVIIRNYDVLSN